MLHVQRVGTRGEEEEFEGAVWRVQRRTMRWPCGQSSGGVQVPL